MLGKVVSLQHTDWPCHLPFGVNPYNTTEHTSTWFTPYFFAIWEAAKNTHRCNDGR